MPPECLNSVDPDGLSTDRGLYVSFGDRESYQPCSIVNVQFPRQVGAMGVDRARAQEELVGDLAVGKSFWHHPKDFLLSLGQSVS